MKRLGSHESKRVSRRHTVAVAALGLGISLALLGSLVRRADAESAPDFRVIVHPDNPSNALERDFLVDVFLKRVTRWSDGESIHPVDQKASSYVRKRFSGTVLQRSVAAVKSYWQQRIFSGRELPPPELESDEAVVAYVLKHRGAVGYVSGAAKLEHVKAVQIQ